MDPVVLMWKAKESPADNEAFPPEKVNVFWYGLTSVYEPLQSVAVIEFIVIVAAVPSVIGVNFENAKSISAELTVLEVQ